MVRANELPTGAWSALAAFGAAMLLGMATWFSAAAVVPQLTEHFDVASAGAAWLTLGVPAGFVVGALVLSVTALSDVVSPRRLIAVGAVGAGVANLAILAADTASQAVALRCLTGACLAAVYPPAMKAVLSWFRTSRSTAVAVMIAALTVGSASPHLVATVGGLDWRFVVVGTSMLSATGALIALFVAEDGPHQFPSGRFSLRAAGRAFSSRPVLLVSVGYFGHMWELYAMWSWLGLFMTHVLAGRDFGGAGTASLVTFLIIGIGAVGCVVGGRVAERWGGDRVAMAALAVSGACAVTLGWIDTGPLWLVFGIGAVWGLSVIADSPQFSALVSQVCDQRYVGSVLTLQMALGYAVTVPAGWLTPVLADRTSWGVAFSLLAIGPIVGLTAMRMLIKSDDRDAARQ